MKVEYLIKVDDSYDLDNVDIVISMSETLQFSEVCSFSFFFSFSSFFFSHEFIVQECKTFIDYNCFTSINFHQVIFHLLIFPIQLFILHSLTFFFRWLSSSYLGMYDLILTPSQSSQKLLFRDTLGTFLSFSFHLSIISNSHSLQKALRHYSFHFVLK